MYGLDACFCADVDECVTADGGARCSLESEKCVNTLGSYRCDCADNFHRRNGKCEARKKREHSKAHDLVLIHDFTKFAF